MREVVRGDKHNLRNLQIATHKSVSFTPHIVLICALQFADFSGCVCHLEQLHAHSPFIFPIVFSINLIPFFDICSVDYFKYLLFFHPGVSGMCCFTWAAARSQQLLFVVLAAGLWCFTAGCHVKSPLFPQQGGSEKNCTNSHKKSCWCNFFHRPPCSTMGESIRPSSFHNPTLSANKHVVQIYRSSLSAAVQTV